MIGEIVLTPVQKIEAVELVLPPEIFFDINASGGLPEWNGRNFFFTATNQPILNGVVNWFSAIANVPGLGTENIPSIYGKNFEPGGIQVADRANNTPGFLGYAKTPPLPVPPGPTPTITPYPDIDYPTSQDLPFTVTLVNYQNEIVVWNLPITYFFNRLISNDNSTSGNPYNSRKGQNLDLNFVGIDLLKSYVTLNANGLPFMVSAIDGNFEPVYQGPYNLFFQFIIF
jgi:hypothetical protein